MESSLFYPLMRKIAVKRTFILKSLVLLTLFLFVALAQAVPAHKSAVTKLGTGGI
jgi:hypothetical protein